MYRLTIKTKYNTIVLDVENYNIPQVQEILEQPYIVQVEIENLERNKVRTLKKQDGVTNVDKHTH